MKRDFRRMIRLGWPFLILFVLTFIILKERMGLQAKDPGRMPSDHYKELLYELGAGDFSPAVEAEAECLMVVDSGEEQSRVFWEDMGFVLGDMRVVYDVCDLSENPLPELASYERVVLTVSELSTMGKDLIGLCEWVKEGGQLMNTGTFSVDMYFPILGAKAGIINTDDVYYTEVYGMRLLDDFMLNTEEMEFFYDEPMLTAMDIAVSSDCTVHMEDVSSGTALLWEREYGKGRFVMINQVLTGKVNRGMLCAAYTLLGEENAYPVINASAYYLDDFPSPAPSGNGDYISRDYGISISSFYSNVWWPDIMRLEEKYGIVHTGMIIEDYSEAVDPPFERNRYSERFTFFGNMLLNAGGELGFHGYNHMPLCPEGYDYGELEQFYTKWPGVEAMGMSLQELYGFSRGLFPEERFTVYVPPSNIMSREGREAVVSFLPDVRVIASTYFEGTGSYTQEFEVSDDGIVETPRITSGCMIDDYMKLSAFSELNFHYVQSHFLHPDDALDEDRGASLGWEAMYASLEEYVAYMDEAAPGIRYLTGSGMGEAVREFDALSVRRERSGDGMTLYLGGFYEEAYLMVTLRDRTPAEVHGGTLEKLAGNRYLLHAVSDVVEIKYESDGVRPGQFSAGADAA